MRKSQRKTGSTTMEVTINGQSSRFDAGATVAALLDALGLDPRKVAVERNREIVPKSRYRETPLGDGDALEIVHFVGGG
jgi:thiamine biosynthesis protein ThiS